MGRRLHRGFIFVALAAATALAPRARADDASPEQPAPPASGWGSEKTPYPKAVEQVIDNPAAKGKKVHLFRPAGAPSAVGEAAKSLPVVLFAHGFGARDPGPYRAWIEHVAREGALVVYPVYPGIENFETPTRYDVLWAGLEAGIAEFAAGGGPKPDVSRLGLMGHSYGGGAVPAIAARAAARGYGTSAMWLECHAPWYDLDLAAWPVLPAKALLLAVAYCDDRVCDPSIASSFVGSATTIPADRKALVVFRSDAHGFPALKADHMTPLTMMGADALDTWGVWRLDDALRAYATTGAEDARAFAFGTDPAARSLGTWSDGTPMARPAVGAVPKDEVRRFPQFRAGGSIERTMRELVRFEPYSALPLPAPDRVPTSRLPYAERVCRASPKDWPLEIERAYAQKAVLVVIADDAKCATVEALDAAAASLAAKVTVLRLSAESAPAKALEPKAWPSVLLFAKGGELRLWKEGDEPNLAPAVLDLLK